MQVDKEGKDSWRMKEAGSSGPLEECWAIMTETPNLFSLDYLRNNLTAILTI